MKGKDTERKRPTLGRVYQLHETLENQRHFDLMYSGLYGESHKIDRESDNERLAKLASE